jgi:hypothetical protein
MKTIFDTAVDPDSLHQNPASGSLQTQVTDDQNTKKISAKKNQ